eukprot:6360454-Pyramimonas_sp.AAC.1
MMGALGIPPKSKIKLSAPSALPLPPLTLPSNPSLLLSFALTLSFSLDLYARLPLPPPLGRGGGRELGGQLNSPGTTKRNEKILGDTSRDDVREANFTAELMNEMIRWLEQERMVHWCAEQPMDSMFYKHPKMVGLQPVPIVAILACSLATHPCYDSDCVRCANTHSSWR